MRKFTRSVKDGANNYSGKIVFMLLHQRVELHEDVMPLLLLLSEDTLRHSNGRRARLGRRFLPCLKRL